MTKIFIGGSRHIKHLNTVIHDRFNNIISQNFQIIVGDANGADKVVQQYLSEQHYRHVLVYCSGQLCRNNIGHWKTVNVVVPKNINGRRFYMAKDSEMAKSADYGLMLWDGKSAGTINNIFSLLTLCKKVVLYFSLEKRFYTISTISDIETVFLKCKKDDLDKIDKKINITKLKEGIRLSIHNEELTFK